jgi:hypothetical protein
MHYIRRAIAMRVAHLRTVRHPSLFISLEYIRIHLLLLYCISLTMGELDKVENQVSRS